MSKTRTHAAYLAHSCITFLALQQ